MAAWSVSMAYLLIRGGVCCSMYVLLEPLPLLLVLETEGGIKRVRWCGMAGGREKTGERGRARGKEERRERNVGTKKCTTERLLG